MTKPHSFQDQFQTVKQTQAHLSYLLDEQKMQLDLTQRRRRHKRWVYAIIMIVVIAVIITW